jgi:DNA-binding transcriptional LysR family regulator
MYDYSLRELECFVAVAEELSFTRAARRIHLAQPPLSRHIRSLEARLGARLFDRSARAVSLTAPGRAFLADIQGALAQLQRAGEGAKRAARGETARLELGFVSAVLGPLLVDVLQGFRREHPGVHLTLHDALPAEQLRSVGEGRLDGGFVGMAPARQPPGLRLVPWHRERLLLFLPPRHPLATARRVALADLAGEAFVTVASEASPAFAAQFHHLCRTAGFRPRIVQEAARAQAVAVMVAVGSGIAVLPASLARPAGDALISVPLTDRSASITHVFAHRVGATGAALGTFLVSLASVGRGRGRR